MSFLSEMGLGHVTSGGYVGSASGAVACGPNASDGSKWCRDACSREQQFHFANYGGGYHDSAMQPYTPHFGQRDCSDTMTDMNIFDEPRQPFPDMDSGLMPDGSHPEGFQTALKPNWYEIYNQTPSPPPDCAGGILIGMGRGRNRGRAKYLCPGVGRKKIAWSLKGLNAAIPEESSAGPFIWLGLGVLALCWVKGSKK